MAKICIATYVYGLVQGVGFRYSTQQQAKKLALTGYARNLDDGGVEIVACGERQNVEKLLLWIKKESPHHANIDRLLSEPRAMSRYADFAIRV